MSVNVKGYFVTQQESGHWNVGTQGQLDLYSVPTVGAALNLVSYLLETQSLPGGKTASRDAVGPAIGAINARIMAK